MQKPPVKVQLVKLGCSYLLVKCAETPGMHGMLDRLHDVMRLTHKEVSTTKC